MASDSDSDDQFLTPGPATTSSRGDGFLIKEVGHRQFRAIFKDGEDPPNPSASLERTASVPITPVGDEKMGEDTRSVQERKEEILRLLKQSMGTVLTHKQKALAEVVREAAVPQRPKLRKRSSMPLNEAPSSRGLLVRVPSAPEKVSAEDGAADVLFHEHVVDRVLTSVNKVRKVVAETSPDVSGDQARPGKGLAVLQVGSSGTTVSPGSQNLTPGSSISMPLIEFEELRSVKEMGRGQFAKVWLCTWRGVNVAMKEQHGFDEESLTNAVKEAETLAALRHPYVLSFYGMVTNGPFPAHIMEYMVHGSLKDKLVELRKGGLGMGGGLMKLKASIALQAARGMDFLHSRKIIHFDLKCANLLCDLQVLSNPIVKIGDVGLSKEKLRTFVSGNMRGTLPWMAPELFPSPGDLGVSVLDRVDEKVDVYSFGVVLWEIWTMGMDPYPGLDSTELLFGIMGRTLKLGIPEDCDKDWASLIEHCMELDSLNRPSFEEIAASLEHIVAMASEDTSEISETSPFVDPSFVHFSSTTPREFFTAETNQYFSAEGAIEGPIV